MLKKEKVIKLDSQEDKDFWLVKDSKKTTKGTPVKESKNPISKQKSKRRLPSFRYILSKFKLPKKQQKSQKKDIKVLKSDKIEKNSGEFININTVFDKIYRELENKKTVSVSDLSLKLDLPKKRVIELAMVFEESGKVDIEYPIIGSPKLVLKDKGEME